MLTACCSQSGWTALYLACLKGHTEVVEVLLANNRLDVNQRTQVSLDPFLKANALSVSWSYDGLMMINGLQEGSTALLVACSNGHRKVVEMLLADNRLVATQCSGVSDKQSL